MIINCTNKGCYATDNHLLDKATNEVHCIECGNTINLTNQMKQALVSAGQIRRSTTKAGIVSTCKGCGNVDNPVLQKHGTGFIAACRKCAKKLDMNASFITAMSTMQGYRPGENLKDVDQPPAARSLKDVAKASPED